MTRSWRTGVARLALAALAVVFSSTAFGQSPANVAVVVNDNSAASQVIAADYARKRAIPATNIFHLQAPVDETIDRATYLVTVEQPIAAALTRAGLQDRILYLVLTKGVPLRIAGSVGPDGTMASVDSELTLLYRRMVGLPVPVTGRIPNPYFLGGNAIGDARRFTHRDHDIYLVTRLDAFTVDEAQMLVDLALKPTTTGIVVLDQRDALVAAAGEDLIASAARAIRAIDSPDRVLLETTPKPASTTMPVLGYFSWGATDPRLRSRFVGLQFGPGALAATFAGADARTFQPPPPDWTPMKDPSNRSTWFGGSPQSLIGDLIREGVTGVAGSIAEPLLQGAVRPDILFPAYLSGFNLVESFYLATPFLSWQTVIVGDPLCQPFARKPISPADAEPAIDTSTELPTYFGGRRLVVARQGTDVDAKVATEIVRAEARLEKGDRAGARALLVQITTAAPTVARPHLRLALLEDSNGEHDAAIAGYRRVLQLQPHNVLALNNLAYDLAVYKSAPMEARVFAIRAVNESKREGPIVDTLAWVEHLLGNETSAGALIAEAVRSTPNNATIRLHAAFISAARGDVNAAATQLKEALRRNPALEHEADVQELQQRLHNGTRND